MAAPRGRGGRGGFGQSVCRPHDIFRQRKQNTSRPPSMHVDDFVAAEFKDIVTPLGLLPPKRPPKSSPKPPTRGLFTGNRGRATFHSQTRFFTPPQPKGVLLSGKDHTVRILLVSIRPVSPNLESVYNQLLTSGSHPPGEREVILKGHKIIYGIGKNISSTRALF